MKSYWGLKLKTESALISLRPNIHLGMKMGREDVEIKRYEPFSGGYYRKNLSPKAKVELEVVKLCV